MAKPKSVNWAEYVRQARNEIPRLLGDDSRWSQSELAGTLGVSMNYIHLIEAGEREPSDLFKYALGFVLYLAANGLDPRNRYVIQNNG